MGKPTRDDMFDAAIETMRGFALTRENAQWLANFSLLMKRSIRVGSVYFDLRSYPLDFQIPGATDVDLWIVKAYNEDGPLRVVARLGSLEAVMASWVLSEQPTEVPPQEIAASVRPTTPSERKAVQSTQGFWTALARFQIESAEEVVAYAIRKGWVEQEPALQGLARVEGAFANGQYGKVAEMLYDVLRSVMPIEGSVLLLVPEILWNVTK